MRISLTTVPRSRVLFLGLLAAIGCGSTEFIRTGDPLIDLQSPDPIVVESACGIAAQTGNLDAIPALIANLRRDDPSVRMFSILTIYDLLAIDPSHPPFETITYGWSAPPTQREAAVKAWEEWYRTIGKDHLLEEQQRRAAAKTSSS